MCDRARSEGQQGSVYVLSGCAVSYWMTDNADDAIQRPIITALCVLSYGMVS